MLFYAYDKHGGSDEHEAAKKLLFSLLAEHAPKEHKDATLEHDENGAPFLSKNGERVGGIYISLSHSHGVCAAAISDLPIGIDIEHVRGHKGRERALEQRFLSRFDIPFTATGEDTFFYKWTYAEACYKACSVWSSDNITFFHREITADGERYILCVAQKSWH